MRSGGPIFAMVVATVALAGAPAAAATITVTSPAGTFTNPGPTNSGDPFAFDTWLRTNVRNGGTVGITGDYPRSGTGSAYFSGPSNAKADFEYYFSTPFAASQITAFGYDWYRDSSSTAPAHLHPTLRLFVDADGDSGTASDRGYLVFELAYNPSVTPVPTDAWTTENALGAVLWSTGGLPDAFSNYTRALADWLALLPNLTVLGLSTGIGSGWSGSFEGAVDNIRLARNGVETVFNFELAEAVPGPASLPLLLAGLAALAVVRRRAGAG